ncbi:carbohydrate ABC transporter permease [Clostridium chromiireducens]|uniref:carbohydrate ABC transporter permease n=1 Tax=Clostridium chromiireducens TaxID=225345 RepID=UPI003AF69B51
MKADKKKKEGILKKVEGTFLIKNPMGRIASYTCLIALVLMISAPLFIVLNVSVKTNSEYMATGVYSLPENIFNLTNYMTAFKTGNFGLAFKNTFILIIISVPLAILVGTMVAYALDRFEFKLKKFLFIMFLVPTFIPAMTVTIATFTIIKLLGLYNTIFAGIILYIGTDIMQIYIFLQFMRQIPKSLDESARLDGASRFKIYWSIILPQMKPAIATAVILKVLAIYNDFFTPYMFMPKSSLRTVATALNSFAGDKMAAWPLMSAAIIFVAIPTVLIYIFLQNYIISGVSDGAVK